MVTIYTMIAADGPISLQSKFYHIQVGNNPYAQKAFFYLGGYCHQHNYYLARRSNEDAEFRLRVAKSLGVQVYDLPCMVIKVEKLVSHLRLHNELLFHPADSANLRFFKQKTDPTFYFLCNTKCPKRST